MVALKFFPLIIETYEVKCFSFKNNSICKKLVTRDYVKKYYSSKVLVSAYCQDVWCSNRQPAIVCYTHYSEREEREFHRFGGLRLFYNGTYTAVSDELNTENHMKCIRYSETRRENYFHDLSERDYDFWRLCPYGWKRTCTKEGITCISRAGGFENQRFFMRHQIPRLRNDSVWSPIALQVSSGLYYTPKEIVPVIQGEVICIMSWTELNAKMNNYRCHVISDYGCEKVRNSFCFIISGSPGNRFRIRYHFQVVRDEALYSDLKRGTYCLNYMPFAYSYCTRSISDASNIIDKSWGGHHKTTGFVFNFLIQRIKIEVPLVKETAIQIIGLTIFTILFFLLYHIIERRISF